MATIEELQGKRDKAKETYEKKCAIVEKHKARKEKNGEKLGKLGISLEADRYEVAKQYGYDAEDLLYKYQHADAEIKEAQKKALEAYKVLSNWEEKLQKEISNMEYLNEYCPQKIRDFLDAWEKRAVEWHRKNYERFVEFLKELDKEEIEVGKCVIMEHGTEEAKKQFMDFYNTDNDRECWQCIHNRNFNIRKQMNEALKEARLDYRGRKERESKYGQMALKMHEFYREEERNAWLCKVIAEDKKQKMIDFVRRIEEIAGAIEDVSYLSISPQGELDGLVIGKKGKAKVNTISAGGWNIQCFHYRVLVSEVK